MKFPTMFFHIPFAFLVTAGHAKCPFSKLLFMSLLLCFHLLVILMSFPFMFFPCRAIFSHSSFVSQSLSSFLHFASCWFHIPAMSFSCSYFNIYLLLFFHVPFLSCSLHVWPFSTHALYFPLAFSVKTNIPSVIV